MERPFDSNNNPTALTDSLWSATAEKAPITATLSGEASVDVAVIGAGFLGLSAAIHLAENNLSTLCVEASEIGWGASGRNNGQVIAGLKHDPDTVIKMLGNEQADSLIRYAGNAPDLVFQMIEKYNITCDAVRRGWIQPAPSDSSMREIESRVCQWQKFDAPVDMIDPQSLHERLGTQWYKAAWLDKRGGSINPLSYARGLAKVAIDKGVKIYTQSPVLNTERVLNNWILSTPNGKVKCKKLLICTNAYTGGINSSLCKSIIPVRTAQVASAPLSQKDWQSILPNGEAASDASKLLTSFRITPDKRLVMGGAYATGGNENREMFSRLQRAARNRFPNLSTLKWQYKWSGYLAITKSHLPQIHEIESSCYGAIGCNGRGIAMSSATGRALAELIITEDSANCPIPVTPPSEFFFHAFRNIGITSSVLINSIRDKANV